MKLKITIEGVAYEVEVEVLEDDGELAATDPLPRVRPTAHTADASPTPAVAAAPKPPPARPAGVTAPPASGVVTSPIAGTVIAVDCQAGDEVATGQRLLVIEAMKLESAIAAPVAGRVTTVRVRAGDTVKENEVLVEFE